MRYVGRLKNRMNKLTIKRWQQGFNSRKLRLFLFFLAPAILIQWTLPNSIASNAILSTNAIALPSPQSVRMEKVGQTLIPYSRNAIGR